MEDQICSSPENYWMKNSFNKNTFLEWKNIYDKDVSYIIQIYFDWIKIYSDIMKKGDIMKIYFI